MKPDPHGHYGLIGKSLIHSFSKAYFSNKFEKQGWGNCHYHNFEINDVREIFTILERNPEIKGFNVTIPYKEKILEYVNELTLAVSLTGASNTIKVDRYKGRVHLTAYNTDVIGFDKSLEDRIVPDDRKALILGNGGASKAVAYALQKRNVDYTIVGRSGHCDLLFENLKASHVHEHQLIINTTPIGTYPGINEKPTLPYHALHPGHFLYDLVYNPAHTAFLKEGIVRGCRVQNGLDMLHLQAEAAWEIWNDNA